MASIVPPLQDDYSIDHGSLEAWTDFMCQSHVPVLFQTYGDGELYNLSATETESIVRTVAHRAKGKALIIGGTTHGWTNHLIEMVKRLEDAGADAVNLHLYNQDEEEIYRAISQVAEKTSLPLLAYESKWTLGLVQRVAKIPRVIGMKCHAELYQYYAFIRATQGEKFGVLSAGQMKHFLFGYLIGSPAYLCPLTPFAPEFGLKFYDAMVRGDMAVARQVIFDQEEPLLSVSIPLGYPNAYKCALYLTGHYQSLAMRPPKRTNSQAELEPLREFLRSRGLLKR